MTKLLGASGISFMFILLSSFANINEGIPITLLLIILFYVFDEIKDLFTKKDNISHLGHMIGAILGIAFGFYFLKYNSFKELWQWLQTLI